MQMVSTKKAMVVLPLPERGTSCFMGVLPWPEGDFCDCTYVRVAGDSFCFCTRFTDPTLELAKHGWNDSRNLGGCQCERFCNTVGYGYVAAIKSAAHRAIRIRLLLGRHKNDRHIIGIDSPPFRRFAQDGRKCG